MRILLVGPHLAARYGGPSVALPEMARALAGRGHYVEIFTTNIDGPDVLPVPTGVPVVMDGVPVTYYPVHFIRGFRSSWQLGLALWQRVRDFDIVQMQSIYMFTTLAAAYVCRRYNVPYVIRPHGTLNRYHRQYHRGRKAIYDQLVEKRNLDAAAGIHCTSAAEAREVREAGVDAPTFVVPLGVDALEFTQPANPQNLLRRHPELVDRELVTFLGRLTRKKGIDLLIEAFAQVAHSRPNAHLVVAGPDDDGLVQTLRKLVMIRNLDARVSFVGLVSGEDKVGLLRTSCVFVLPSRDENFGVSVVEALAAGIPVVLTRGVAIHEEVMREGAGLVVARNPVAVADAIVKLLGDRDSAREMGSRGQELARSTFTWRGAALGLEQFYQSVLESR